MRVEKIENKIITADFFLSLKRTQQQIVFTNGCFDILHRGHAQYLAQASDVGDLLIVGLNSDASIKKLKGEQRPIITQQDRAFLLASLECVNYVIIFDELTPYDLIQKIKPDVLIKGSDYNQETIVGADVVKKNGGKIITIDLVPNCSTSGIIEKIRKTF